MTKREIEREEKRKERALRADAQGRMEILTRMHDAYLRLTDQTIDDICKARQGKVFKFMHPKSIPDPRNSYGVLKLTSVYWNGTETRVNAIDPKTGDSQEYCLHHLEGDTKYLIATSISQVSDAEMYKGEWC